MHICAFSAVDFLTQYIFSSSSSHDTREDSKTYNFRMYVEVHVHTLSALHTYCSELVGFSLRLQSIQTGFDYVCQSLISCHMRCFI